MTVSLSRGVAFFEDGTEVSNITPEAIKALPALLEACKMLKSYVEDVSKEGEAGWDGVELADKALAAIEKEA